MVASHLPQPARAAHQRIAPLQTEHRGHERAVPFATLTASIEYRLTPSFFLAE
jgi:hypothetical protein